MAPPQRESAWDYPRPPRVEASHRHLKIIFNGTKIAETTRALRVLETGHAPVYYIPREDVRMDLLRPSAHRTWCEWKGEARYFDLVAGPRVAERAIWAYEDPRPGYEAIRDALAFYAEPMDACLVDGERAEPQPSRFYGGWVTRDVVGPFKGEGFSVH